MLQQLAFHTFKLAAARGNGCSTPIFGQGSGTPGLYDGLCTNGKVDIQGLNDILILLGNIVRILTVAAGGLAVIFIIIGAVYYVISAGDPGRLKQAKEILTQAIVGLIVISLAYAVVTFITGQIS